MIEIIATAALAGSLGLAAGYRLGRSNFDELLAVNAEQAKMANDFANEVSRLKAQAKNDKVWLDERAATMADLEAKLRDADHRANRASKPDTQAVSDYMREIGARGNASPARLSNRKRSAASQRKAA